MSIIDRATIIFTGVLSAFIIAFAVAWTGLFATEQITKSIDFLSAKIVEATKEKE